MKKVIYFTTSQDLNSFQNEIKNYQVSPNLSNQNFHNKLIRCLSLNAIVDVVSVRPINKGYKFDLIEQKIVNENNVIWHYPLIKKSKIDKFLNLNNRIASILTEVSKDDCLVFVDILNLSLLKSSYKFAKNNNLKIIGVCTDNPNNISFTKNSYKQSIIKLTKKLDGYICLTQNIAELFDSNKPSLIIDGITEDITFSNPIIQDKYIYFGGSLMRRYGVFELIDAYKQLKLSDIKLVITGHHEPDDLKDYIKDDSDIIYLGPVSYKDSCNLSHYSLCSINPRPIEKIIDDYSFPSKVLEYMSCGTIVVSTMSPIIYKNYSDAIIWSTSSNVNDLYYAIKKALSLDSNQRSSLILKAKKEVNKRTSFTAINELINKLF